MRRVRLPSVRRGAWRAPPGRGGSDGGAGRLAGKGAVRAAPVFRRGLASPAETGGSGGSGGGPRAGS